MTYVVMHQNKAISGQILNFFVDLMIMIYVPKLSNSEQSAEFLCNTMFYGVRHHNKAISEQSSKFLCNTEDLWSYTSNKAISEQSSKFLSNTEDLWSYTSKQSNFRTEF